MGIPDLLIQNTSMKQTSKSIIDNSIANINRVLSLTPHYDFFTYTSEFESPFRKFGVARTQEQTIKSSQEVIPSRPQLLLKGVLLKEKSLAIIEDKSGQTYIRSIGETVLDQQIVSINADKVVLRDRKGTYELAVEEN
jgi:predicted kinase